MTSPGRLALVAGAGDLVPRAIAAARESGWEVRVLALHQREDLVGEEPFLIKVSRPDLVLKEIRRFGATHVCAVGGMHMSDRQREKIATFASGQQQQAKGDAKLSQLGGMLLKILGIPFIGVHEIVSDLLAEDGQMGGVSADEDLLAIMKFAFSTVRRAGELDLGQALVVSGERVVATEDIGGTDELLARCASFRQRGLIGDGEARIVLAKSSKPGQPLHIDLPAIGPETILRGREAGISAIVIEAGRTLMIERDALIAAADDAGIVLWGMTSDV